MENFKINNINTYLYQTKQFKTIRFSFVFNTEASIYANLSQILLNILLTTTSKIYPTKALFNDALFSLYNANIYLTTSQFYKRQYVILNLEILEEKFVKTGDFYEKCLNMVKEILYNPHINNGLFDEKLFKQEKNKLIANYKNRYNDKPSYSLIKLRELMLKGEEFLLTEEVFDEVIKKITNESLYQYYQDFINHRFDLYVVGNITSKELSFLFKDFYSGTKFVNCELVRKEKLITDEMQELIETQDNYQSILCLGAYTNINKLSPDFFTMQLFATMLGGSASSSLDTIIREEHSLAYFTSASYNSEYGLLIISMGIDASNKTKALELINEVLLSYQEDENLNELFMESLDLTINSLKDYNNSSFGYFHQMFGYNILGRPFSEELISQIKTITLGDIQKIAKTININAIYYLEGKKNEEN